MKYPHCGTISTKGFITLKSWNSKEESTARIRVCTHCGQIFVTYELRSDCVEFDEQ